MYEVGTLTKQESSFFHKGEITWWNDLTQEHLKQQLNTQLKPQRRLAPLRYSDQGRNLPLYPVDLQFLDELQSTMIQNYSFVAHKWAQDWGFMGHMPSGCLLGPGLKFLPWSSGAAKTDGTLHSCCVITKRTWRQYNRTSKVPLGAQGLIFHPISYLLNRLTTYCMLVRFYYTLD